MARTNPIGVRFDPDKLDFVKKRENLESNQQVVDLLINRYWWDHKMPVPTHKEAPPLNLKSASEQSQQPDLSFSPNQQNVVSEPPKASLTDGYYAQIKAAGSVDQIKEVVREFKKNDALAGWQKQALEKYAIEMSRKLDF